MSTVNSAAVTSALATKFAEDVVSVFNRTARLAGLIPCRDAVSQDVRWAVRDVNGQVSSTSSYLADGTDVSVFNTDSLGTAVLSFAQMSEGFAITPLAMAQAGATGNPAQLADLAADELRGAAARLFSNMNKEVWLGTGAANRLAGLLDATNGALMATGIYAGIDKGSITAWAGNQVDKSAAAITEAMVVAQLSAIEKASGKRPDLIVTSFKQRDALAAAIGAKAVYNVDTNGQAAKTYSGGYNALMVNGIPVIADKDCPDADMIFLSMGGDIELYQLPPADAKDAPTIAMPNGLKLYLIALPFSGGARKWYLRCFAQLKVKSPTFHGALTNLG